MKDSRRMKLALVQLDSLKGDVDGNLDKIEAYAKKAGEVKVDLLVFHVATILMSFYISRHRAQ